MDSDSGGDGGQSYSLLKIVCFAADSFLQVTVAEEAGSRPETIQQVTVAAVAVAVMVGVWRTSTMLLSSLSPFRMDSPARTVPIFERCCNDAVTANR